MKTIRILLLTVVALCATSAFSQTVNVDTVTFAWNPSTATNITNYRLYFGKSTNVWTHFKDAGNALQTTVGITEFGRWFFIATARDTEGLESLPSNMVTYDVKNAPGSSSGLRILSAIVTRIETIIKAPVMIEVP